MMEKIFVDVIKNELGTHYNSELIMEIINRFIPEHYYGTYTSLNSLDIMIEIVCTSKNWNIENTLTIYGDNLSRSCMVLNNMTLNKFIDNIKRLIELRVFL